MTPDHPGRFPLEELDGLVEVAGWSPAGLAALFARAGWLLPSAPGETLSDERRVSIRLTPSLAWVLGPDIEPVDTGEDGCLCDLSHSRLRLRLEGPSAAAILSKTVAVDVHLPAWPAGRAVATGIHGVPVLIHRAAAERFDVLIPRSFARSIRDWIADADVEVPA